jgi:integrase
VFVPARSVALIELFETFLRYHQNLDRSDSCAIKQAFQILLEMFPDDQPKPDTSNFKVGYLVKFQNHLTQIGYARSQVNRLFKSVKRVFSWAGQPRFDEETWEKLPPIVSSIFVADMNTIKLVKSGKENPPRIDVPQEDVELVFPYVPTMIADMLRIQILTGMRPSEVCKMKIGDIKRTKYEFADYSRLFDGENWIYILSHKTESYIGKKAVPLGLQEQEILEKYLIGKSDSPVFRNRKGSSLSRTDYGRKIKKAIEKNNLPKFVPYQIRHTSLTKTSEEHSRDIARAVAGHTTEAMTARYDHSDLKKFMSVVRERNRIYKEQKVVGFSECTAENYILKIFNGN